MWLKFFLFLTCTTAIAADDSRIAAKARVWLKVPEGNPPVENLVCPGGEATESHWEADPSLRARQQDVHFPIAWWRWARQEIRFTPAHTGSIELRLMGPWSPEENGATLQKYVWWDDLSATGAELLNAGFEDHHDGTFPAWESPWAPTPPPAPGRSGKQAASTWLNTPLVQTIQVTKGRPVTLVLHARAATPPGFAAPRRLPADTPAHRALARLKRGMNFGNGWEVPPGSTWGLKFTIADIDRLADQGFDHVRLPICWHKHLKNGAIDPALFAEIEPLMKRALDRKLHILLDWHGFDEIMADPAAHRATFIKHWGELARRYRTWPDALWFELLNEPCQKLEGETLNRIFREAIAEIRGTNPQRIILASPGGWGNARELSSLHLPDDDDRIVVTIHCYDPMAFTHQGAAWVKLEALAGIVYPGPPAVPLTLPGSLRTNPYLTGFLRDYNRLPAAENPSGPSSPRAALTLAHAWGRHFGRPIHLGEFGAFQNAEAASRARYLRDVRHIAEGLGIPWALWEWKAGFGYWDAEKNQPRFRAALID